MHLSLRTHGDLYESKFSKFFGTDGIPITEHMFNFVVSGKPVGLSNFENQARTPVKKVFTNHFTSRVEMRYNSSLFRMSTNDQSVTDFKSLFVNDWEVLDFVRTSCRGTVVMTIFFNTEQDSTEISDYFSLHLSFYDPKDYSLFKLIGPFEDVDYADED